MKEFDYEAEEIIYNNSKKLNPSDRWIMAKKYNDKIRANGSGTRKAYRGDKYNSDNLRENHKCLSLNRTAGESASILYMLGEKENGNRIYSVDQIMSPNQLIEEKRKVFEKIVKADGDIDKKQHLENPTNDTSMKLSDTLYECMLNGLEAMDELAEQIDFTDDQFMVSDKFLQMCVISGAMFDVWQELSREFKVQKNISIRKKHPELSDKQCEEHLNDLLWMSNIKSSTDKLLDLHYDYKETKEKQEISRYGGEYVKAALVRSYTNQILLDWKANGNGLKISEFMRIKNYPKKFKRVATDAGTVLGQFTDDATYDENLKNLDKRIVDGSLFVNVEFDVPDDVDAITSCKYLPEENGKGDFKMPKNAKLSKKIAADKKKIKAQKKEAVKKGTVKKSDKIVSTKKDSTKKESTKKVDTKKADTKKTDSKTAARKSEEKKSVSPTAKKLRIKKDCASYVNGKGQAVDFDSLVQYLGVMKANSRDARGFLHDSDEYIRFYLALDDVLEAAMAIQMGDFKGQIVNATPEFYDFEKAVRKMQVYAAEYEEYKLEFRTEDLTKEPNKMPVNSDDKRKLEIVRNMMSLDNRFLNLNDSSKKRTRLSEVHIQEEEIQEDDLEKYLYGNPDNIINVIRDDDAYVSNEEFMARSKAAVKRLGVGDYNSTDKYLEDAGLAIYGQLYKANGNHLINAETGEDVNLWKYMNEKIEAGELQRTLQSKKNPDKLISADKIIRLVSNKSKLRGLLPTAKPASKKKKVNETSKKTENKTDKSKKTGKGNDGKKKVETKKK